MNATQQILNGLQANGHEAVSGKGGFFVRGIGFVTTSKAKAMAGLKGNLTGRTQGQRVTAHGDYAIVAAIVGRLNG